MNMGNQTARYDTIVIGGGQAGLVTGYYLKQSGRDFIILEASQRVGDAWRKRWDSLHLFTPARLDALPGMPFPAPAQYYPTKNEMADYLESYADHFALPIQLDTWVERLYRDYHGFVVETADQRLEADNVVVAMGSFQIPWMPAFASELGPGIVQMHSAQYRKPSQLQDGDVLVVGAGNSGAEIAMDVARSHRTWLAGRDVGQMPFRIDGFVARNFIIPVVIPFLGKHLLTVDTPIGRKARPKRMSRGAPLVRVKREDMAESGIKRVPRVDKVRNGLPELEDGRTFDVANVIWCTGYRPSFSWINLPVFGGKENPREPVHERGVVAAEPGLYFVGLFFLYSLASSVIAGVGRDAAHVVKMLAARQTTIDAQPREMQAPVAHSQ